jgi:hypothetical protein
VQESAPVLSKSCLQGVSGLYYKHKDPNRTNTILPRKVDCISCQRESEVFSRFYRTHFTVEFEVCEQCTEYPGGGGSGERGSCTFLYSVQYMLISMPLAVMQAVAV